jgi:UDP-N-acetylmuramoylalanine--D-glutamate ligase
LGVAPVLVDDEPPGPIVGGPSVDGSAVDGLPVLRTDRGGMEALERCEVVVKTPGISRYRPDVVRLVDQGIPVAGGLGLWMEEADRDRVVCVTGTKGKSTTAAIAGHLLDRLGYRCLVGGNIGRPPWDPAVGGDYDFWVVETSSFQATDLASSPSVVAVTSLSPDHLDWHGGVEAYYRDKLSACAQRGARLTVADGGSALLVERRALLGPEVRWVAVGDPELDGEWVRGLGLLGEHNHRNALIARACLAAVGVPEMAGGGPGGELTAGGAALVEAAAGFDGLESRLRLIGTVDGVEFVDDSLSTNVLPTLAALDAFAGRRVALVVGGFDRGIDYRPLAEGIAQREAPTLVLTLPSSGPRIHVAIHDAIHAPFGHELAPMSTPEVVDCPDLAAATGVGFEWARPGGVVLLSPAAPSFGQFRDYRERAAAFADAMQACGTPES